MKIAKTLIGGVAALGLATAVYAGSSQDQQDNTAQNLQNTNAASQMQNQGQAQQQVDINSANAKDIAKAFNGFGKKRAQAIVAFRDQNRQQNPSFQFNSANDLSQVKGISSRFVKNNNQQLHQAFSFDNADNNGNNNNRRFN